MARITFPSSAVAAYKGAVSEMRSMLSRWGGRIDRSPGLGVELGKQISAFMNAYAIAPVLAATQVVISNAQSGIAVANSASVAIAGTHTADVAGGALTRIRLATTVAPVVSGVKVTMPNVTGTYVNGITFTVVNGVITAAVAS